MRSENKKVLVIGGSQKPERYSNKAIRKLLIYNHEVSSIGLRSAEVAGVEIQTGLPLLKNIHTVTMYVGPAKQDTFYNYIIGLKPKRVIFNPGTENQEFNKMLEFNDIEVIEHCTLVMLDGDMF